MSQLNDQIVIIPNGKLKGTVGTNLEGEHFLKFSSIPYAKPPIDDLRFKPPQPPNSWAGVRDATQPPNAPITIDNTKRIVGSEDCLYLNVYTRQLPKSNTKLRPVMVHIHGGGFHSGSSRPEIYGPDFLMMIDVVLVTVSYRVGILGFLSIEGTDVLGNMGLKDQNLALKWVQENIRYFNGNPANVTIFGESAGAVCVHSHILSPASKGLFHKAIIQGGCMLNPMALGSKNIAMDIIKELGEVAEDDIEALEVIKRHSTLDIVNTQSKFPHSAFPRCVRAFGVVIEEENETAFLTKHPRDIISEGSYNHVPIMMGYADTEGLLCKLWSKCNPTVLPYTIEDIVPYELSALRGESEMMEITDTLRKLYLSCGINPYDAATDGLILAGKVESLTRHMKNAKHPIYFYRVSLLSQLNFLKRQIGDLDEPGAAHVDELGYLFRQANTPDINPGSLEDKSIKCFVELWTNFAEYGDPTYNNTNKISWKPVESRDKLTVLDIGTELRLLEDIPERQRIQTWIDIYKY